VNGDSVESDREPKHSRTRDEDLEEPVAPAQDLTPDGSEHDVADVSYTMNPWKFIPESAEDVGSVRYWAAITTNVQLLKIGGRRKGEGDGRTRQSSEDSEG
jgi:hypothetical protein